MLVDSALVFCALVMTFAPQIQNLIELNSSMKSYNMGATYVLTDRSCLYMLQNPDEAPNLKSSDICIWVSK